MIEILRVTAAFGIKGAVRVFLYTYSINHYKKIYDLDGNEFNFKVLNQKGDTAVIKFDSVNNRNEAENLRGTSFFIKKEDLPELESNQFYICDLIGQKISVISENIDLKIVDVKNFGAGDLIEILEKGGKDTFFIPFTKENFPEADDSEIVITADTYKNFKN